MNSDNTDLAKKCTFVAWAKLVVRDTISKLTIKLIVRMINSLLLRFITTGQALKLADGKAIGILAEWLVTSLTRLLNLENPWL